MEHYDTSIDRQLRMPPLASYFRLLLFALTGSDLLFYERGDRGLEPEREVMILCAFDGLDYASVADALGIPAGTVGSRMNRARARLKKMRMDREENVSNEHSHNERQTVFRERED